MSDQGYSQQQATKTEPSFEYGQDEVVRIHSIPSADDGEEFIGVIKGKSDPWYHTPSYIVDMLDKVYPFYNFTHTAFHKARLKPASTKAYAKDIRLQRAAEGRFCASIRPGIVVFEDTPAKALEVLEVRADARILVGQKL